MQTVISGSKLHIVTLIKFNVDLMECVVTAATEDQEWQDAYNAVKNSNPSVNIEYFHRAFSYKR
jgi:hypothetical protein